MTWLLFAILAYFILALVSALDKVILTKSIVPKPAVYAIYTGLTSAWGLFLIPFGFRLNEALANPSVILWALGAGIAFVAGLIPFYSAAKINEISRIAPLAGVASAVFTLLFALAWLGERLNGLQLFAAFLLIGGGFLISFQRIRDGIRGPKLFGLIALAGILFAASFVLAKRAYLETSFLNAFILYEVGFIAAGVLLLLIPSNRRAVAEHLKGINVKIIAVFGANKSLAGLYFILLNYAIFLGSVGLTQAVQGLQYVFLFIIASLLSVRWPHILKEDLQKGIVVRKVTAIVVIMLGLSLLPLSQRPAHLAPGASAWGVTFSKPFAEQMGLDWRAAYAAILDDLKVTRLRLIAYWPEVEKSEGVFSFEDLDWQVQEAVNRQTKIILAVGQKLPRWPECHIPAWTREFPISSFQFPKKQEEALLRYIKTVVERYKDSPAIWAWQVENEPFLPFGECPSLDVDLLDREIALVKSLDSRPIIVSDSGELSAWISAAKRADIFGTTMYRVIWNKNVPFGGYFKYPLPPEFFHLKANVAGYFADIKKIIVVELQAEPWGPKLLYESPFEEQQKSMNFEQFKENIEYAKAVGFPENYLWGVEWWYWLKETQNHPEFWNYAKELFVE